MHIYQSITGPVYQATMPKVEEVHHEFLPALIQFAIENFSSGNPPYRLVASNELMSKIFTEPQFPRGLLILDFFDSKNDIKPLGVARIDFRDESVNLVYRRIRIA